MIPLYSFIFTIIGFFLHLYYTKRPKNKKLLIELFLAYLLFFSFGINNLTKAFFLIFFPIKSAQYIGWNSGCIFEYSVGIANLALGSLAISCFWVKMKHYWLSTIIGNSIFYWGNVIGYIMHLVINNDFQPKAGVFLAANIFFPIIAILCYSALMNAKKTN